MRDRFPTLLLVLVIFAACGADGGGGDAMDADDVRDVPTDLPADAAPDPTADGSAELPCTEGETACDGTFTALCRDAGVLQRVADCAADGWICQGGRCVTTAPETEAEAAWRQRLDDLRMENARTPLQTDATGGWTNAPAVLGAATPGTFFRVEKRGGAWWLVTPEGHPFLSKGVTDVAFLEWPNDPVIQAALAAKYPDLEAWLDATLARLRDWGFNTAGPWSNPPIRARILDSEAILDVANRVPRPHGSPVTDFFEPGYPDIARQVAAERCAPRKDDPNLLGWFLDNELIWDNCWQTKKRLLRLYFEFQDDQPGRAVALAFLRESAGDSLAVFNAGWKTSLASWDDLPSMPADVLEPATPEAAAWAEAFALKVFERYAGVAVQAIREADPNHLILGCRFSTWHFDALMAAAAKYFDVISLAYYWDTPPVEDLDRAAPAIDRPFLLEEWSFKGEDSGLMNVLNFAPVVPTQQDRGLAYARYVESLVRRPWVVAYHWYKWFDNPPREDNFLAGDNFGLMNSADEPYLPLVRMAAEVNRRVEAWHVEGVR